MARALRVTNFSEHRFRRARAARGSSADLSFALHEGLFSGRGRRIHVSAMDERHDREFLSTLFANAFLGARSLQLGQSQSLNQRLVGDGEIKYLAVNRA